MVKIKEKSKFLSVTGKSIHDQIFKMVTKLKASKKMSKME